ncbi:tRNA dihydrouridine(20/20a) synthase DusA [Paenalcaligenes suwonensis]|uniref:tRNA dihydrouridine(20/20a) synthase DusA n=1 Tax=Paenalcaligenes suwonensis TaxID=1202713 RepID=UPI0024181831|nr:tRNA dihydrouridine(20/20a) synthase DusA [Paenalcaligenes suwonensis]
MSGLPNVIDNTASTAKADWTLCVAPMIDVTDKHCRLFHRMLAPRARLYTEMITTGALQYGDVPRLLDYDSSEHPVALQLGGSEPAALAHSAKLGEQWGYDEINLNCGCPSERVQKGAFGACLMAEPNLVADCVKAMQDVVSVPVTVKHRLGLDYEQDYGFAQNFVGILYEAGVRVFVVHARNAVLKGLSPKENREIPPLRYDYARQLVKDFPDATFVLNGGLATTDESLAELPSFAGVMLGRAAWHTPAVLREISQHLWPDDHYMDGTSIVQRMYEYAQHLVAEGLSVRMATRAMLGWPHGLAGARQWRRTLSDASVMNKNEPEVLLAAWEALQARQNEPAA